MTRAGRAGEAERRAELLHLERYEDVSGVSGVGIVAYGARFPDGSIALRWDTKVRTTVFYDSLEDLEAITGHGGRTQIIFDSEELYDAYRESQIRAANAEFALVKLEQAVARWLDAKDRGPYMDIDAEQAACDDEIAALEALTALVRPKFYPVLSKSVQTGDLVWGNSPTGVLTQDEASVLAGILDNRIQAYGIVNQQICALLDKLRVIAGEGAAR